MICRDIGSGFVRVGGVADHVHIAMILPRTISQAELIEQIKTASSKWIKKVTGQHRGFSWQRGYGIFSLGQSELDSVIRYVDSQEEHHRIRTFQEEYRDLLRRHGTQFDERYVWD